MKIYSFLPSATEMVYLLGKGDDLCGVTHECDYPVEARKKPVVIESLMDMSKLTQAEIDRQVALSMTHGHGLYRINRDLLDRDKPDLILTQELCDVCSISLRDVLKTVSELASECDVLSLTPRGLDGVLEDIVTVGEACGVKETATKIVRGFRRRIEAVRRAAAGLERPRVFCIEWFDPIFASGHWVPEMVEICGGAEMLGQAGRDSHRVPWGDVASYDPEVMILMPCGFNLTKTVADAQMLAKLKGWNEISAVKNGRVYATAGSSYYSRPGPRLVDGLEMMARMIHPEVFGRSLPRDAAALLDKRLMMPTSSA